LGNGLTGNRMCLGQHIKHKLVLPHPNRRGLDILLDLRGHPSKVFGVHDIVLIRHDPVEPVVWINWGIIADNGKFCPVCFFCYGHRVIQMRGQFGRCLGNIHQGDVQHLSSLIQFLGTIGQERFHFIFSILNTGP